MNGAQELRHVEMKVERVEREAKELRRLLTKVEPTKMNGVKVNGHARRILTPEAVAMVVSFARDTGTDVHTAATCLIKSGDGRLRALIRWNRKLRTQRSATNGNGKRNGTVH